MNLSCRLRLYIRLFAKRPDVHVWDATWSDVSAVPELPSEASFLGEQSVRFVWGFEEDSADAHPSAEGGVLHLHPHRNRVTQSRPKDQSRTPFRERRCIAASATSTKGIAVVLPGVVLQPLSCARSRTGSLRGGGVAEGGGASAFAEPTAAKASAIACAASSEASGVASATELSSESERSAGTNVFIVVAP